MFSTSTHRKFWMLEDENKVKARRNAAHDAFVERSNIGNLEASENREQFLSFEEADRMLRFFERQLMNFCNRFKPPMPKAVIGTSFTYFKRFYLNNSVMDYHPKVCFISNVSVVLRRRVKFLGYGLKFPKLSAPPQSKILPDLRAKELPLDFYCLL